MTWVVLAALVYPCMAQDSLNVHQVGRLPLWDYPSDMVIRGNAIFLATGASGLHVVRMDDVSHPVEINSMNWFWNVTGLAIQDTLLYVIAPSNFGSYFDVFTIGDSANITQIGSCSITGNPRLVAISGQYAYVTDWSSNIIHIMDISDPANPLEAGHIHLSYLPMDITIRGSYAYVVEHGGGLQILDLTYPTAPFNAGVLPIPGISWEIVVDDTLAMISNDSLGLVIVNTADPSNLSILSTYNDAGVVGQATVFGNTVYLSTQDSGLVILDITDRAHPIVRSNCRETGSVWAAELSGNYVCLAGSRGLSLVNVSDGNHPVKVGGYGIVGDPRQLDRDHNRMYLSTSYGLHALDISTPSQVTLIGLCDQPECVGKMCVVDDRAYICNNNCLRIVDMSNPASPSVMGSVCFGDSLTLCLDVAAAGTYAYVTVGGMADDSVRLFVVGVSQPETPAVMGSVVVGAATAARFYVAVSGNYVGVTNGSRLKILDVSDPSDPMVVSAVSPFRGEDIVMSGSLVYSRYVDIIDISDPLHPQRLTPVVSGYNGERIAVTNGFAFLSIMRDWPVLDVVDTSDPMNLVEAGYYSTNGWMIDIATDGRFVYAMEYDRLSVLDCAEAMKVAERSPAAPKAFNLDAYPNPFNASINISYDLPISGRVSLRIYDVLGRMVSEPVNGFNVAGGHQVLFDGAKYASGIYFIRMESGSASLSRRIVLLK